MPSKSISSRHFSVQQPLEHTGNRVHTHPASFFTVQRVANMRFSAFFLAALAAVAVAEPGQYGQYGAGMPGQQIQKQPTMKVQSMLLPYAVACWPLALTPPVARIMLASH
jgi:hypothetical protein